jgi:RimJ/RimL family protein N-acetyltransferase
MIACHLITDASPEQRRQLAGVMASDGDSERFDEFVRFLDGEFDRLDAERRFYVVAELKGMIIGFVRIWHSPHIGEWVNDGIVVLPEYRRQAVGGRLLKTALALAAERGAKSVVAHVLDCNPASILFHERMGFEREVSCYRNSYGELRAAGGWQYRIWLS